MLKVTADTNTLISAAITQGNEFQLLRLARLSKIKLILSLQILEEFKEVIARPKFGFSEEQIKNAFKQIINIGNIVIPTVTLNTIKDDPEDNKILECAISGKAEYIMSGDIHLLNLKEYKGIKIIKTSDILKLV